MKIKKKKKEKKKDEYDFAFEGNKDKLSNKEKELAIDLMAKHFSFFGEINYLKENEAVLRGAKITCTHGNKTICLDAYKDHGVYDHKIPVMTCSDCKQGQNIYSFGACGNDKFEPVYSEQLPPPKGYVKDAQGVDRHKCLPLLDKSWGTGGAKSRIAIVCFNGIGSGDWLWNKMDYTDERKLAVLEEYSGMINKGEYVEILLSQANLLCLYGGIITVEENPEVEEDFEEDKEPKIRNFMGKDFMIVAENNIPYIYSTKQYNPKAKNPYPEWTGVFDSSMDLTFGIGHSIKTEDEFKNISKTIQSYKDKGINIQVLVDEQFKEDINRFVDKVNEFCIEQQVFFKQNQFDAVVMLIYNCDFEIESSDLGKEFLKHSGEEDPNFNKENIVNGFTYTMQGGKRMDGLVTRRNNELNLFLNADYTYYDSKEKVISQGINEIDYP